MIEPKPWEKAVRELVTSGGDQGMDAANSAIIKRACQEYARQIVVHLGMATLSDLESQRDNLLRLLEDHRQHYANRELELIEVKRQLEELRAALASCRHALENARHL
jgi:chromosome segregation ATPase